jgi:hypothetical membrane protein
MLIAASTWPGYSHVTRYVSELGGPESPHPAIFNYGIVLMGVVCTISARLNALAMFPWIGVAGAILARRSGRDRPA